MISVRGASLGRAQTGNEHNQPTDDRDGRRDQQNRQ
ncbi:MAG: hypothetical protein QOF64_1228, partial [Candidatus Binatota bacterium]|nr:hypothetical protein [Candidatus Binatota bacterium]